MRAKVTVNIVERGRVVRRFVSCEEVDRLKEAFTKSVTGDNRGRPIALPPPRSRLESWIITRLAPPLPPPLPLPPAPPPLASCGFCVRGIVPAPEYDLNAPPRPCTVCGGKGVLPVVNRAIPPRPRLLRLRTALRALLRLLRRSPLS